MALGNTVVTNTAYAVGQMGNVIAAIWREPLSKKGVTALQQTMDLFVHRYQKIGLLVVIEQAAGTRPDKEGRAALEQVIKTYGTNLGSVVLFFSGVGIQASLIRNIVNAVTLVTRTRQPTSVHGTLPEACERLAKDLKAAGAPIDGGAVLHFAESLRGS